jgi:hypothetical protein
MFSRKRGAGRSCYYATAMHKGSPYNELVLPDKARGIARSRRRIRRPAKFAEEEVPAKARRRGAVHRAQLCGDWVRCSPKEAE